MNVFDSLFKEIKGKRIDGFNRSLKSLFVYNKFKETNKSILLVTSNLNEAGKLYNMISSYTDKVWLFPMDDFLTSEALAVSPELKISRLETMDNIVNGPQIVITNLMGYLRYLPNKEKYLKSKIKLKVGETYDIDSLINKLVNIGYKKETMVNMTGEIATRGFVLDIFSINYEEPIRIEFWGDEIDSIRHFDVDSQLTTSKCEEIVIYPSTELLIDEDNFDKPHRILGNYKDTVNISGYLDNYLTVYDNLENLKINYNLLAEEMFNYTLSLELPKNTKYMYSFNEVYDENAIIFEELNDDIKNKQSYHNTTLQVLNGNAETINNYLLKCLKDKKTVIICLENRYKINNLLEFLQNNKIIYTNENQIFAGKINVINKKITMGFSYQNYIVLTEKEIYGKEDSGSYKTKFRLGTKIKDLTKLEIGDYVVHNLNGIGRYLGLKTIVKNGLKKDYLMIEYADNDKLYIPVEKIDLISKYSSKDGMIPKLNKLGSKTWQKTKARARKKAEDIAADLLKLYAARESQKGFAFKEDTKEQIEFEKQFSYTPTPDQIRVIEEIKKDMEKAKPMDRLLCGDVGYGKTEVAFRAIFKAILSGKQAAILCPTTILSLQHYKNALNRFQEFPVKIAVLNRFITPKKVSETLEDLKEGKIDLLIGTHRILSDDVIFKDLGLLVIDEEQRFGVKHKEKIKKYKNNIDVLTLSATPIPRTLQMSMAGIRSLSLIETPPVNRYPIQTYVLAENNGLIKDAIEKELARNGQVFILYNRVEHMESKKMALKKLVPDAKIAIANGQMDKRELENIMIDFTEKKYDILLCTTIIETGIDIENVNTLIILDADRFGLSQLYQIRGRIGRGDRIGYCYLMYDNKKILSEVATKRLKVIKDFTELGSGFAIAMRDLSIRGAGDLLGSEQAGFIDSIGIELFLEMLNEEVLKLQGKEVVKDEKTNPLIDVETYIDDAYVDDNDLKIEIHKKINTIDSEESLIKVKNELEDRFGKVSDELIIYMYEELFEKLADKIKPERIKQSKNSIEITLNKEMTKHINGDELFYEASKLSRMFRFGLKDDMLVITLDIIKLDKHFIYYLIDLMKIIDKSWKKL